MNTITLGETNALFGGISLEKLTQKDWLDFINRLQERERQKTTSGGINNWVLFVAIGAMGYFVFPEIPLMLINVDRLILYTAIFLNFSNSLFQPFHQEFRVHKIINYRKTEAPILEIQCRKIMKFYELTVGLIAIALTSFSIILNSDIRLDILIILGITVFSMLTFGLMSVFVKIPNRNFQRIENVFNGNDFSLFIRFIKSHQIYISLYPLVMIITVYHFNNTDLRIALFGLIFVLIILLFQFIIVIFTKRLKIAWLEDFEREIIISELSDYEIRKKLRETYFKLSHIDDFF
ncbi:hypothetical protein [Paenibacillus glycinis]|uniref:ABC transporter permease n=1 Tax=Paenibacillus glycinis TaxID=2697035 RepID=A0ABW9XRX6_9BACL|nr:hypothetical protein [Paenibacillus glycinis]NBD25410.1 hypothetical protein [Paenibacillus glycinis]